MKSSIPWIALIAVSSLIGVAAAIVHHRELPTFDESVRQAAVMNEEAAFELTYDQDQDDHDLLEATIGAINQRARRYRPTPEEVAEYRIKWREMYRQRWLRKRHPSDPGSR